MASFLDVWDIDTFDDELISMLCANANLLSDYIAAERHLEIERRRSVEARLRSNSFYDTYREFLEDVGLLMSRRSIRAWHYTRLTDSEVASLRAGGIELSTMETARRRLDTLVTAGAFSAETATALLAESPLHDNGQRKARQGQFCLTSDPLAVEDSGVTLLLNSWGGEVLYFWLESAHLKEIVAAIGSPRVLEIRVPVDAIRNAYQAADAVVASFARSLGCVPDFDYFDVFAIRALGPDAVLAVHTKGDATFDRIGKGYPITRQPREA